MRLILFLLLTLPLYAQDNHFGVLFNGQFEGRNSGNGNIVGMEFQHVHAIHSRLKAVSNLQITSDQKVYRGQYGGAVRFTSLVRYAPDKNRVMFGQAGLNVGGILFPDTPGTDDGYAKYVARPVLGGGVVLPVDDFTAVLDYQWHVKRKLMAQRNEFSDYRNRFVDGWTSGHKVGVQTTTKISENYLLLLNANAGWYTYQRNPARYGAELGSVVHRFTAFEVSVGFGRKY